MDAKSHPFFFFLTKKLWPGQVVEAAVGSGKQADPTVIGAMGRDSECALLAKYLTRVVVLLGNRSGGSGACMEPCGAGDKAECIQWE